jgi:hypothetical protein
MDFAAEGKTLSGVIMDQLDDRSAWKEYAGRLARVLPEDEWLRVENVYWRMQSVPPEARQRGIVRPDRAADIRDEIDRAMMALEPRTRRLLGIHRGHIAKPDAGDDPKSGPSAPP